MIARSLSLSLPPPHTRSIYPDRRAAVQTEFAGAKITVRAQRKGKKGDAAGKTKGAGKGKESGKGAKGKGKKEPEKKKTQARLSAFAFGGPVFLFIYSPLDL